MYFQGWEGSNPSMYAHHVYGVDARDGTAMWTCIPGQVGSLATPVVSRDGTRVFVADQDDNMYAVVAPASPIKPVAKCCEAKENYPAYKVGLVVY